MYQQQANVPGLESRPRTLALKGHDKGIPSKGKIGYLATRGKWGIGVAV
jgi:hypothetical protein